MILCDLSVFNKVLGFEKMKELGKIVQVVFLFFFVLLLLKLKFSNSLQGKV
jgi:hypothetical protein